MAITLQAGQKLVVNITIRNNGQEPGSYSLTGTLTLPGTGTTEAHLSTQTGTLQSGEQVTVTLESLSGMTYGQNIAGYDPNQGLDLVLILVDTSTGVETTDVIKGSVLLQYQPPVTAPTTEPSVSWGASGVGAVTVRCSGAPSGADYQLEHTDQYGNLLGLIGENASGSFTLTGPPGSVSHVRARICNSAGCGPWSSVVQITFPAATSPSPSPTPSPPSQCAYIEQQITYWTQQLQIAYNQYGTNSPQYINAFNQIRNLQIQGEALGCFSGPII